MWSRESVSLRTHHTLFCIVHAFSSPDSIKMVSLFKGEIFVVLGVKTKFYLEIFKSPFSLAYSYISGVFADPQKLYF